MQNISKLSDQLNEKSFELEVTKIFQYFMISLGKKLFC